MQASKVNGYITIEGRLVVDALLSLPAGEVEVIVLSADTNGKQYDASDMQISYTPEQEATIKSFLASAGCGRSGNPDSSVSVDAVLYGGKK